MHQNVRHPGIATNAPVPVSTSRPRLAMMLLGAALAAGLAAPSLAQTASPQKQAQQHKATPAKAARHKVIFQVSDGDPKKWALTLNNARNVQAELGADKVDIEIVAYGPGIGMLKADSESANRVQDEAIKTGIKVVACENTMTNQKLNKDDMIAGIGYVRAGVVELMLRQKQGYAYIRP
jgi:intracellular sulfur oxidation DsrE/DsrF family protein